MQKTFNTKPETSVITGSEHPETTNSPYAALVEFYNAFNTRNLDIMTRNWNNSDEASMSNPLGGIKRGWNEIQEVYKKIFNGTAQVYVEYYDYTLLQTDNMFCTAGRERGHFLSNNNKIKLEIRTSRIYRYNNNRWQQIHHHGSIDNPELLSQYQLAVSRK
jgi:hypothetical protein